jgi:hypothetical protein
LFISRFLAASSLAYRQLLVPIDDPSSPATMIDNGTD